MFSNQLISNWMIPYLKPKLHKLIVPTRHHSMISRNRMQNLYRICHWIKRDGVAGDIIEAGVARGGSAVFLALVDEQMNLGRELWFYDAFELIDPPNARYEDARRLMFETFKLDPQKVHLFAGWFADSMKEYPDHPVSLLHIDTDGYDPVTECLDRWFPLLSTRGWVVLDNYSHDENVARAVADKMASLGQSPQIFLNGGSQGYFQKTW